MIERIVVGVDEHEASHRALRWAAARARELDAEVVAVHAVSQVTELIVTVPPLPPNQFLDDVREDFERKWCAPLAAGDVKHRELLVEGSPADVLMGTAEQVDADMIVVGARSHGNFADRLLGSVTYKVAHRAHHPVVIVPAPADVDRLLADG